MPYRIGAHWNRPDACQDTGCRIFRNFQVLQFRLAEAASWTDLGFIFLQPSSASMRRFDQKVVYLSLDRVAKKSGVQHQIPQRLESLFRRICLRAELRRRGVRSRSKR